MSPTRPDSVDANAWWSPSDNEWIFGHKDDDDELHGTVTYWRPDGTLVNHCEFDHGYAHGAYVRYHPSGEVSRKGTLVRGRIHGTDTFFRSESETTETFPAGLHAKVWRAELDMVNGSMVAGRLFDKEGRSVGEDGEPHPERPESVPDDAVYSSQTGRWLQGRTEDSSREGTWRFYAREGWLHQETVYDGGEIVRDTVYGNAFESRATMSLGDGDFAACEAAITEGLEDSSCGEVDHLCLQNLSARALMAQNNPVQAVDVAHKALAHPITWGTFTATGKRAFTARAALKAIIATDHLTHGRNEEALTEVREAIALTPRSDASL